jgi:uncharacterized protein
MDASSNANIIQQTKKWIFDVVIGCNFCPFANTEMQKETVHYQIENSSSLNTGLQAFIDECTLLDTDEKIATTLLIFPNGFDVFNDYLELVSGAEGLLDQLGYSGKYQVASFHPLYNFADVPADDAANYSNRSIYPMLHLLREDLIDKALLQYPNAEGIPQRNIDFARKKGAAYMQMLRDACL